MKNGSRYLLKCFSIILLFFLFGCTNNTQIKKSNNDVLGKICGKVWYDPAYHCHYGYMIVDEDERYTYLKRNVLWEDERIESRYFAMDKRISDQLIFVDYEESEKYGLKKLPFSVGKMHFDTDGFWEWDNCKRKERRLTILDNITDVSLEYGIIFEVKGNTFEEFSASCKKHFDIELKCPNKPEILKMLCEVGDFCYTGVEDKDYYYSSLSKELGQEIKLSKKTIDGKSYTYYYKDKNGELISYVSIEDGHIRREVDSRMVRCVVSDKSYNELMK